MHILIVTDQHPDSLGGAQVAIRAQWRALEQAGHVVTIAAPALHRGGATHRSAESPVASAPAREALVDPRRPGSAHIPADSVVALPSIPITRDREYSLSWPGARSDRALASGLRSLPPVDLVHLEGDFWGALIGLRAARGLRVPVMHTLHNNVGEGTRAVTPLAPIVFQGLRLWRWLALGKPRGTVDRTARGAWRYLAELAAEATIVSAPSKHFANQLMRRGVAREVLVTRNGVDDALVAAIREDSRSEHTRPRLVWLGRMSHEKRVLEFVDALALARVDADITLYGAGLLLPQVRARVASLGLADRVTLAGPVSHEEALVAIHNADALVQTSIGFETQGLTPFEAALLGTPTIFSDPAIAADVAVSPSWLVAEPSVNALAHTLAESVAAIAAAPGELRVPFEQAREFLQSEQTGRLLEQYEGVLEAPGDGLES
ncbi:glycosyltransferase [Leucobacter sp. W1153]|uniref:glycosyltransferase n=1 Tax=Leucobacter sp. W1153 TaxID=3439064 RepID=UPI003F3CEDEF